MTRRPIKYLDTAKGDVLKSIVIYGAKTFPEIEEIMVQLSGSYVILNKLLNELIVEGDVTLNENGVYRASQQLEEDYSYYEVNMSEYLDPPIDENEFYEQFQITYPDILTTANEWLKLHSEITCRQDHFYLEGNDLDTFSRFLLTKAFQTIIVVNPFIDHSTHSQLLVKAKRNGKNVVVVTRQRVNPLTIHRYLEQNNIKMLYHKDLHAKIIIIDDKIAVVSSMNFLQKAAAGISWEAGMVTMNPDIVSSIKESITDLNL